MLYIIDIGGVSLLNYRPLFISLAEKGIQITDLKESVGVSSSTLAKFRKNEYVSLRVIETICLHYDLPIEKVVQINN